MTTTDDIRIVNPLIRSIPAELDRDAVFEALLPLLTLLGITTHDYYAEPGLTITREEISFSIPAQYPPVHLGRHGRTLKEAETRITVRLTPEEVDGFTYQRVAAAVRADDRDRLAFHGQTLVRSGWRSITGVGTCTFCATGDQELVAAYGAWNACQSCYVGILPSCQP